MERFTIDKGIYIYIILFSKLHLRLTLLATTTWYLQNLEWGSSILKVFNGNILNVTTSII